MKTVYINNYEVSWDGRRVWINGPDGMSRARYKPGAIDLHHDVETQMATGNACDACGPGDWSTFVSLVHDRLGVVLPAEAQPR